MTTVRSISRSLVIILVGVLAMLSCAMPAVADEGGNARLAAGSGLVAASELATQGGDIADCYIYVESATYTGTAVIPEYTVKTSVIGQDLAEGTDYSITFTNNTTTGYGDWTVEGMGDYTGVETGTFAIFQKSLLNDDVTVSKLPSYTYTGKECKPKPTVKVGDYTLVNGKDYVLDYDYNVDASELASVSIQGIGGFTGTLYEDFVIRPAKVKKATFVFPNQTYNGYSKMPKPKVAKFNGKSIKKYWGLSYAYTKNKDAGTAKVVITGSGNFCGKTTAKFKIKKASLAKAKVKYLTKRYYNGKRQSQYPYVSVGGRSLSDGVDYKISYKNNVNAGEATMIITGKGNYTGKKSAAFAIEPASVYSLSVGSISTCRYTGGPVCPSPKVTYNGRSVKRGVDYTLSYSNNVSKGVGTIVLTGKGNFSGTRTILFIIS